MGWNLSPQLRSQRRIGNDRIVFLKGKLLTWNSPAAPRALLPLLVAACQPRVGLGKGFEVGMEQGLTRGCASAEPERAPAGASRVGFKGYFWGFIKSLRPETRENCSARSQGVA